MRPKKITNKSRKKIEKKLKLMDKIKGEGMIIIISISKKIKIKHNLKKCKLNGDRTKLKGSKPHSKGVVFL